MVGDIKFVKGKGSDWLVTVTDGNEEVVVTVYGQETKEEAVIEALASFDDGTMSFVSAVRV